MTEDETTKIAELPYKCETLDEEPAVSWVESEWFHDWLNLHEQDHAAH